MKNVLLILWCGSFLTIHMDAKTIRVPQDYALIKDAINAAEPHDTIRIAEGNYDEKIYQLIINKPLTMVGADSSLTKINKIHFSIISVSDVHLEDMLLTFDEYTYGTPPPPIVTIDSASFITLRRVRCYGRYVMRVGGLGNGSTGGPGVSVTHSDNVVIEKAVIVGAHGEGGGSMGGTQLPGGKGGDAIIIAFNSTVYVSFADLTGGGGSAQGAGLSVAGGSTAYVANSVVSSLTTVDASSVVKTFVPAGVSAAASVSPDASLQLRIYPNPANPTTTFSFNAPVSGLYRLIVRDMVGRTVETVADGEFDSGEHAVRWNAARYASGMYFCQLIASRGQKVVPLIVLK